MTILHFEEASEFTTVETGWYLLELENCIERDHAPDDWNKQPYKQLELVWLCMSPTSEAPLLDPESGDPILLRDWVKITKTWNDKSNMYKVTDAMGMVVDGVLTEPDTNKWLTKRCMGNVLEKVSDKDTSGRMVNRIEGYAKVAQQQAPARRRAVVAIPPAPQIEDDIPF